MRKIVSLTLMIGSAFQLITSVILYLIPSGRVAYWADYQLFGLNKTQWGDIHISLGTLLLVLVGFHIYYNWRSITSYLKNKAKQLTVFNRSFNIALAIALYVSVGTLYSLPPMNFVLQFGEYLTELGNEEYGEPPYGHAELSSLKMFCKKMDIDLDEAVGLLKDAGVDLLGSEATMQEIARSNELTPKSLHKIMEPATSVQQGIPAFPNTPPSGFGKETLETLSGTYDLHLESLQIFSTEAGLTFEAHETVKEIATKNETNPMALFEIIEAFYEKEHSSK